MFFFILQDKVWIGNEIDKMNDEKEVEIDNRDPELINLQNDVNNLRKRNMR